MCCGSLTAKGKFWAFISILAAGAAGTCFYWPDWVNGTARLAIAKNSTFEYGLFRRCNYIERQVVNETQVELNLREACGRYETFSDIPSVWWQACTILVGVGAGLLILVALTALFAVFLEDVCSRALAYVAGGTQLLAGKASYIYMLACSLLLSLTDRGTTMGIHAMHWCIFCKSNVSLESGTDCGRTMHMEFLITSPFFNNSTAMHRTSLSRM